MTDDELAAILRGEPAPAWYPVAVAELAAEGLALYHADDIDRLDRANRDLAVVVLELLDRE